MRLPETARTARRYGNVRKQNFEEKMSRNKYGNETSDME